MGKERKLEKYGRTDRKVQMGGRNSETTSGGGGRIQKNGITGEVYGEVVVWVG